MTKDFLFFNHYSIFTFKLLDIARWTENKAYGLEYVHTEVPYSLVYVYIQCKIPSIDGTIADFHVDALQENVTKASLCLSVC